MNWDKLIRSAEQTSDPQEAERLWGLALIEAQKMQHDLKVAVALDGLAMTFFTQNRLSDALDYFKRSLDLRIQNLGTHQHILVACSYNNLASVYIELDQLHLAQQNLTASLVILLICSSIEHPLTRQTMRNLLFVFQRRHRQFELTEAAEWLRLARNIGNLTTAQRDLPNCEICKQQYKGLQCLRCTLTGLKPANFLDFDS